MMDKSQVGRAGELAIELYALVTSGGEVDMYSPVVDDDHVDLVAGIRGGPPTLGIQVKTTPSLDHSGLVEARASFPVGHIRQDPNFLYAVVLLNAVRIEAMAHPQPRLCLSNRRQRQRDPRVPLQAQRRRRLLDLPDRSHADRAQAHDLHRGDTASPAVARRIEQALIRFARAA